MQLQEIKDILCKYDSISGAGEFFQALGYEVQKPLIEWVWEDIPKRASELINAMYLISHYTGRGGDFRIFHIELKTNKLRRTDFRIILEPFYRRFPQGNYLFVFTTDEVPYKVLAFVSPLRIQDPRDPVKIRLLLRMLITEPKNPYRTDLEVLNNIVVDGVVEPDIIWEKHYEAFNVQRVTDRFFRDYQVVFRELQSILGSQNDDKQWAHDYALQILNRILFLYFIQRKRLLLGPDGQYDTRFMRHFWEAYKDSGQCDVFFREWLNVLFFEAFNKKWQNRAEYRKRFPDWVITSLAQAPYLNGGLFTKNRLDQQMDGNIPDAFFTLLFDRWVDNTPPGFFERYNFTIIETTRFDEEVAVDPEMIGKVYESLVNITFGEIAEQDLRGEAGIFYTPRTEIDLMCRLALVDWLANHVGERYKNLLYQWVFAYTEEEKQEADEQVTAEGLWEQLDRLIRSVTVCDPACGSGSFLVGMLLILDDLQKRCNDVLGRDETPYERRKRIIQDSLYGVDVMEWAVHVAELRLWLQLVVETELHPAELQFKPLLPNLSFKIRQGDSLVQEIGGVNLGLHRQRAEIPPHLAGKLTQLKGKKLRFYKGDIPGLLELMIQKEEENLFYEILWAKKKHLEEEIKKLEWNIKWKESPQKLPNVEMHYEQTSLTVERLKKERDAKRIELERVKKALDVIRSAERMPFVWDMAFMEIFESDKRGFDIVIGNPPYVRQGKIADPTKKPEDYGGRTSEGWKRLKAEYKEKLQRSVWLAYPRFFRYETEKRKAKRKIDGRADYYVYFYLHGLSLLNEKGTFCFITSNSWLDVGFGKDLQEFLLKHSHMKMILDNQRKRSFRESDINTVIVLLAPADDRKDWGLDKVARFVTFKVPFEEVLSPVVWMEIEETTDVMKRPEFRCVAKKQRELYEEGVERLRNTVKYAGNKLGGKYLRAPDIYFKILEKAKDKLVRLGDIAKIRRGFTTGANEFFYLEPLPYRPKCPLCGVIHEDALTRDEERRYLIEGRPIPPQKLIAVKNGAGWEGYIEAEFLKPVIKSLREIKTIYVYPQDLNFRVFICHKTKEAIKGTHAGDYIEWGENAKYVCRKRGCNYRGIKAYCPTHNKEAIGIDAFPERPTCRSRIKWWDLGEHIVPPIISSRRLGDRHLYPVNNVAFVSDTLYEIKIDEPQIVAILLTSTFYRLLLESEGRELTGAITVVELYIPDLARTLVLNPFTLTPSQRQCLLSVFEHMASRGIKSIFEELGFELCRKKDCEHPEHPYEFVDPQKVLLERVMPDRRELDKIVFEAIGLTEEEQLEVYRAVVELVKNRLVKARSV